MHPGPLNRGIEVDDVAADGDHSVITTQIENGIFVRMASLYWVFTSEAKPSSPPELKVKTAKAKTPAKAKRTAAGAKKK
ncbi:hypothetical protein ABT09_02605 [bacterium SCN 57-13]|nr:MAG: hypothetical protein ABT09_02605 [bacterium SCN 57-13]